VDVSNGQLEVRGVPYVDAARRVCLGSLAAPLRLAGDRTMPPGTHMARWTGSVPCDASGRALHEIVFRRRDAGIRDGRAPTYSLCARPLEGDPPDYHALITMYAALISGHADAVEPGVTARVGRREGGDHGDRSPFAYVENASARAGIAHATARLAGHRVAIVGMGGTGGYLLDQLAKTPVSRIHLVDDDLFEQHNAWRAPGAASRDELASRLAKVAWFDRRYSVMHRGIVPHPVRLGPRTFSILDHVDFCFLCVDDGRAREGIVRELERRDLPFIDTGLGLELAGSALVGAVRVTTSLPGARSHVWEGGRVPMAGGGADDVYRTDIQTAELNALAAILAVIRWKKAMGFYFDAEGELSTTFTVDGTHMLNEHLTGGGRG
jgi:hypothetical protein